MKYWNMIAASTYFICRSLHWLQTTLVDSAMHVSSFFLLIRCEKSIRIVRHANFNTNENSILEVKLSSKWLLCLRMIVLNSIFSQRSKFKHIKHAMYRILSLYKRRLQHLCNSIQNKR